MSRILALLVLVVLTQGWIGINEAFLVGANCILLIAYVNEKGLLESSVSNEETIREAVNLEKSTVGQKKEAKNGIEEGKRKRNYILGCVIAGLYVGVRKGEPGRNEGSKSLETIGGSTMGVEVEKKRNMMRSVQEKVKE
jgi:hypothetical protein